MSKTALIILNYNNCHDTRNCIESVLNHNTAPVKFIVVDNASKESDRQELCDAMRDFFSEELYISGKHPARKLLPHASLVLSENNVGYAQGNNLGLDLAYDDPDIDKVMILNNDILFTADIIPTLVQRLATTKDCGIISPVLYKPNSSEYDYNCARKNETISEMIKKNYMHYWWRHKGVSPEDVFSHRYLLKHADMKKSRMEIELPSGSCMLAKKSLFQKIGSFDPNTFLYYEENILFKKIQAVGLKNYLCLDLSCIHLGAATTKKLSNSLFTTQVGMRSQYYYASNYSGENKLKIAALRLSELFYLYSVKLQKIIKPRKQ
mgnify:FL=1